MTSSIIASFIFKTFWFYGMKNIYTYIYIFVKSHLILDMIHTMPCFRSQILTVYMLKSVCIQNERKTLCKTKTPNHYPHQFFDGSSLILCWSLLRYQCFKSAWMTTMLHEGFKFPANYNGLKSAQFIENKEVQWTLGAILYLTRFLPLR